MNLIFFQNCISPHQMPYIKELSTIPIVNNVIVIAPTITPSDREKTGWNAEEYLGDTNIRFYISPSDIDVNRIIMSFDKDKTICLFSGIKDFKEVYNWFQITLKFAIRRAIIKERPNTFAFNLANGKPLWLHRLRFFVRERKLAKNVDYVFAMGAEAVTYFKGLSNWKVFPFCYCTKTIEQNIPHVPPTTPLRICFVGALEWWKNVKTIILSIAKLPEWYQSQIELNIIGDGSQRKYLSSLCTKNGISNAKFLGIIPNEKIPQLMAEQDVLILPSIYDGWGAVVNEALLTGLYVICSTNAGACELINNNNGKIFTPKNTETLSNIIREIVECRSEIRKKRDKRIVTAKGTIGGGTIATYLIECLTGKDPIRPWVS